MRSIKYLGKAFKQGQIKGEFVLKCKLLVFDKSAITVHKHAQNLAPEFTTLNEKKSETKKN